MRVPVKLAVCVCVLGIVCLVVRAQQISLAQAAERAVNQSKLTLPGSVPFHLTAKIAEKDSPQSDLKADVEVYWASPERWRRTIKSDDFTQTIIVNGTNVSEQDDDGYYPLWLHTFVTAMLDPLPMLESLKHTNANIEKPPAVLRSVSSTTCARLQAKAGIPPVQNSVFYVYCFQGDLLEDVTTPEYSIEFHDYKNFEGKHIARLLVTDPEPGTTIEARIIELTRLKNVDDGLFAISQPTPKERQIESVMVSESQLRTLAPQNSQIDWPTVRSGNTSGNLSLFVSIDRSGHVRETFPLNSDNAGLDDAARQQVQKWQFKPAAVGTVPVQVEGILTFAFNTKIENPIPVLSDEEARKLAANTVEPRIPSGTAASGTSFTIHISVDAEGKLTGAGPGPNVSNALFFAAYAAITQWHFQPYVRDGKPDAYDANIAFKVP